MTAALNVLFGPRNLKINQEKGNGSHIVHVHFESNPEPSPGNVTFVIERTKNCEAPEVSCEPITVMAGSQQNNFNASALENQVGVIYFILSNFWPITQDFLKSVL